MIQVETLESIDNLDDILTQVPDIDAVWPGVLDLRASMGLEAPPPMDRPLEPEYIAAMAKFDAILKKHDMPRSSQAVGPPNAMRQQGKDNSLSFVAVDVLALRGQADMIPAARAIFPAERRMQQEEVRGR